MPKLKITEFTKLIRPDRQNQPLYLMATMLLFWTIFDCMMTYATPLLISQQGFSNTAMGAIIASSSVAGGLFDFLVCRFFKNTNFRRIFLLLFACCLVYPLILWKAKTILVFLIAMIIWGIYYDLFAFGTFDFIGRYTKKERHASSFGLVEVFRAIGGILGPIIAGLVIVEYVTWRLFAFGWAFLVVAIIFFLVLVLATRKIKPLVEHDGKCRKNVFAELHLWKKISKIIWPPLIVTFILFFNEAFFWTLAPLYAEEIKLEQFGGLFLTAFTIPALVLGWVVGGLTRKLGKKKTAFGGLLFGSLILSFFMLIKNPIGIIALTFTSSCFISLSWPAISGAYADYISETPSVEGEVEALEDFAFNLAYVLGPFFAGVLADLCGIAASFTILGIFGAVISLLLFGTAKREIKIDIDVSMLN